MAEIYRCGPRSATTDRAAELERIALDPHADVCDGLEHAGVQQHRRAVVLRPANFCWELSGPDVVLGFDLPAGGYATSLLLEAFELDERSA